jgi:hypothetical protein
MPLAHVEYAQAAIEIKANSKSYGLSDNEFG